MTTRAASDRSSSAGHHPYPLLYDLDGRRLEPPAGAVSLRVRRLPGATPGRPGVVRKNNRPWVVALTAAPEELVSYLSPGLYEIFAVDGSDNPIGDFSVDFPIDADDKAASAPTMTTSAAMPSSPAATIIAPEIAQAFVAYRQMAETATNIIRQMGEANAKLVQAHAHTLPHMPAPQLTALAPIVQEAPQPTAEEEQAREEVGMRKFMSDVADVARAAETFAPVVMHVVRGGRSAGASTEPAAS